MEEEKLPTLDEALEGVPPDYNPDGYDDEIDPFLMKSSYNDYALLLTIMEQGNMSEFDARCFLAKKIIEEFMEDGDINALVREKQADYIHDKGWSKGKRFKEEYMLPLEAWLVLPMEIRDQPKILLAWLKENSRYMVFQGAV